MTATATRPREAAVTRLDDDPHPSGEDRYAIYAASSAKARKRLAETSQDGIGLCLVTLRDEGDIGDDTRVGILDRLERRWIVNPWAKGVSI